jgi:hypothetical protein
MFWYSPPDKDVGNDLTGMTGGFGSSRVVDEFAYVGPCAHKEDKSSSFRISLAKAHAIIFEPSVRLPAPKVAIQSEFRGLASLTIERISDQGVCGRMPTRVPTTFEPRAASSRFNASVLSESDFEAMMYTRDASNVSSTCFEQASGNGSP